ncbi:MAG: Rieske (2Fe-2S) domain protein [Caulobacter sp.]|nr:Rieske (2Fe-2S) domain protein [Caulobacter sp.]
MTGPDGAGRLDCTPAGVKLCALSDLADPGARNFVLQIGERYFHGFVVRVGDGVSGYVDRCPHMGLPLAKTLDDYLSPDGHVVCGWHGAVFEPTTGLCRGGPCVGASLTAWPVRVMDGVVVTA